MHLLLIHQAFATGQEAGGTRHYEFGQRLAARGDRLTVVAGRVSYLTGRPLRPGRRRLAAHERANGVTVLRAYAPAVLHRGFAWRVAAFAVFAVTSVWCGLRAGPVDVVMGTTPSLFQAASAWLVARLRGKPFLLEVRDLWPAFAIELGILRQPALQVSARWLEHFLYRHADHLLVNSPAYRAYLLAKRVPAAKISLVPNGADVAMFDPAARGAEVRRRYGLDGAFVVVYAGAHGPANDLATALRAAETLQGTGPYHFLFVGDGKDRARLEAEAARRRLTNVTFAGPLPKDQIPQVLAAADACLATLKDIPLFTTTCPNKVFDYMAAGRPTILAIDGVIRRVIEEAGGGVFAPPGDAAALSRAVVALAADPARCAAMGMAARRHVAAHFNRDDQAEAFRRLLHRLAGISV